MSVETIIVIILAIAFFVYLYTLSSNKESTKEKIADGVNKMSHDVADSVGGFLENLVEPEDKKTIRLAQEALADRHGTLYRMDHFYKGDLENLYKVDDSFRRSLEILGLTEEEWKNKVAVKIFYIGQILILSRDSRDYSKRLPDHQRQYMMDHWVNDSMLNKYITVLKEALAYFHISEEEWIKYGDAVIEMYNLREDKYLRKYGYIVKILPMQNNMHLL